MPGDLATLILYGNSDNVSEFKICIRRALDNDITAPDLGDSSYVKDYRGSTKQSKSFDWKNVHSWYAIEKVIFLSKNLHNLAKMIW